MMPTEDQLHYMVELLRAAKCPFPGCVNGEIISTGPEPQNDACEWCYRRRETVEAFGSERHQSCTQPEREEWAATFASMLKSARRYVESHPSPYAGKDAAATLLGNIDDALRLYGECHQVGRESSGADAIAAERTRQMDVEKWNPEHDDDHDNGSLTRAALVYASLASFQIQDQTWHPVCRARTNVPISWPWDSESYKPKDARRNLVRAGALIAAEIDRLDRAADSQSVACTKQEGARG